MVFSQHFKDLRKVDFFKINFIKSWVFFIVSVPWVCILFKYHLENFTIFSDKVLDFNLINIFLKCKISNFNRTERFFIWLSWNICQSTNVKFSISSFSFLDTQLNSSLFNLFLYFIFFFLFFKFLFFFFNKFLIFYCKSSSFYSFKIHLCFFFKFVQLSFLYLIIIAWSK